MVGSREILDAPAGSPADGVGPAGSTITGSVIAAAAVVIVVASHRVVVVVGAVVVVVGAAVVVVVGAAVVGGGGDTGGRVVVGDGGGAAVVVGGGAGGIVVIGSGTRISAGADVGVVASDVGAVVVRINGGGGELTPSLARWNAARVITNDDATSAPTTTGTLTGQFVQARDERSLSFATAAAQVGDRC